MAMAKLGGGITEINGKMGGDIWRKDQCGQHVQATPRKIKQRTEAQTMQRACFLDASNAYKRYPWRHAELMEWIRYCIDHPVKNKKGETVALHPRLMFIKTNMVRMFNHLLPIYTPPE